jgi:hypothetical protein
MGALAARTMRSTMERPTANTSAARVSRVRTARSDATAKRKSVLHRLEPVPHRALVVIQVVTERLQLGTASALGHLLVHLEGVGGLFDDGLSHLPIVSSSVLFLEIAQRGSGSWPAT